MRLIAISGGIGSGKSVVCRILTCLGFPVYDCDIRARKIMDDDAQIKQSIHDRINKEAIDADGNLDRGILAETVFNSAEKLNILNQIVHGAVRQDLAQWYEIQTNDIAFVETAILYQSGLDRMVDEVWEVVAPTEVRIDRVCKRNSLQPEQVLARIKSQDINVDCPHPNTKYVLNDGHKSILLQLRHLLAQSMKKI